MKLRTVIVCEGAHFAEHSNKVIRNDGTIFPKKLCRPSKKLAMQTYSVGLSAEISIEHTHSLRQIS